MSDQEQHKGFGLGLRDRRGIEIRCGDTILHMNENPNTKPEYWYGLYRVVWKSPCFVAEHIGGGKRSDVSFDLRCYPERFLVVGSEK